MSVPTSSGPGHGRMRPMKFAGFSRDTVVFLKNLSRHNERAWFEAHRADYESSYVQAGRAFAAALGPRLQAIDAEVHAEPRSLMRIHRDTRFAKDKRPYKDHLDLWFWTGPDKGWDGSGFFFRLTPTELLIGGGM